MRVRGWGPFKQTWGSICSAHQSYDPTCNICALGSWHNLWLEKLTSFVHDYDYDTWFRIVNRIRKK